MISSRDGQEIKGPFSQDRPASHGPGVYREDYIILELFQFGPGQVHIEQQIETVGQKPHQDPLLHAQPDDVSSFLIERIEGQIDNNFIHLMGPQEAGKILEISQQRVTGFLELRVALPLLVHKTHNPITQLGTLLKILGEFHRPFIGAHNDRILKIDASCPGFSV